MKNKGRQHLAKSGNCKGCLMGITRPVGKMGRDSSGDCSFFGTGTSKKYTKKKWSKRVRGYFKTSKWSLINENNEE